MKHLMKHWVNEVLDEQSIGWMKHQTIEESDDQNIGQTNHQSNKASDEKNIGQTKHQTCQALNEQSIGGLQSWSTWLVHFVRFLVSRSINFNNRIAAICKYLLVSKKITLTAIIK